MDYFLHAKCGYQVTEFLGDLAPGERTRLWKGYLLWQVAIENAGQDDDQDTNRTSRSGHLGSGDRKMLRELNTTNSPS